jgi:RNA polymerase sigma-70 factor (ECF subfamily)
MESIDIQKFRGGDEELFRNIIEAYSERLFNIVIRMVRNVDDSEDIVQETFTRAYMKRNTFKGRSSLYTWLVRIALNRALNHMKKQRPMDDLDPRMASASNPEAELASKELAQRIDRAIRELPSRQRMVFILRFHEKMPYREISNLMKCKEGTAKALYHFAVERLSSTLSDLNPRLQEHKVKKTETATGGGVTDMLNAGLHEVQKEDE